MVNKNVGDSVNLTATPGGGPSGTVYTVKFYYGNNELIASPVAGTYNYTLTDLQESDAGIYYATSEYTCTDGTKKGPTRSGSVSLSVGGGIPSGGDSGIIIIIVVAIVLIAIIVYYFYG